MTATVAPKRRISRLAIALMVVSVLVGGGSAVRIALAVAPAFTEPSFAIPGTTSVQLEPGRYAVYELTGSKSQTGPITYSSNHRATIGPGDVTVTDPAGQTVVVERVTLTETLQRDEAIFTAAVTFRAASSGRYTVAVDPPTERAGPTATTPATTGPGTAVVAPDLGDKFASLALWFVLVGVAAVLFVIGFIAMIISAVRAGKANRPPFIPPPQFQRPGTAPY